MDSDQHEREALFTDVSTTSEPSEAKKTAKKEQYYNYRPVVLRTGPLLLLLLTTGAFIGLLQYALCRLPHDEGQWATQAQTDWDITASEQDLRRNKQSSSSGSFGSVLMVRRDLNGSSTTISDSERSATLTPTYESILSATATGHVSYVPAVSPELSQIPSAIQLMPSSSAYMSIDATGETVLVTPTTIPSPRSSGLRTKNIASTTAGRLGYLQSVAQNQTIATRSLAQYTDGNTAAASIDTSLSQTQSRGAITTAGAVDTSQLSTPGQVKVLVYRWNQSLTFIGTYLVVLLGVLYRLWLAEILNKLTLIEPFRQLMSVHGAPAWVSFFSFYHEQSAGRLLLNLRHGRFLHFSVNITYLLGCLLPALGSEAVWIDTGDYCGLQKTNDTRNPCPGRIVTSVIVARIMQVLLAVIFVIISAVAAQLLSSSTGLSADPSSVAAIAGLMRNPDLADDLDELSFGSVANIAVMKSAFKGKLYGLGHWRNSSGESGHGIFPLHEREPPKETIEDLRPSQVFARGSHGYTPMGPTSSSKKAGARARRSRWMDFLLLLTTAATFAIVLAYYLDHSNSGFNRFFSSDAFGPRFIFTGAGTVIAKIWSDVELSTMVMAPYLRLTQRPAPTYRALSFKPTSTPFVSTWRALRHGYITVAIISLTTLLSEALSIFISGVPYSSGEIFTQAVLSVYTTLSILGSMMIVAVTVIWRRKYEPKIPVHPDTLAAKMVYMAGSRMLDDFEGGESEKSRDKRLASMQKRYEFKPRLRKDGTRAWLVDEVKDERGSELI